MARVLVVDDQPLLRSSVSRALSAEGLGVDAAGTVKTALELFRCAPHDVVVLDLKLPDGDGISLLAELRALSPEVRVILITAHGTVELAVEAMKRGATDFVKKPFELDELLTSVRQALGSLKVERRLAYHDTRAKEAHSAQVVRGRSPSMAKLWAEVEKVAAQLISLVLLRGESGAGKTLVARELHYRSARRAGPFVELNAASIPETLLESELFGHERGAFSDAREPKVGLVEVADGGTFFLDEIGDLAPSSQAKLLRFLESFTFRRLGATELRSADLRLVAATNQPLEQLVEDKRLRADLYYRLSALVLTVPPLRERREDVAPLAEHFLEEFARRFRRPQRSIVAPALDALTAWPWPGNVRELGAVIQRAVLMYEAAALELEHLPAEIVARAVDPVPEPLALSGSRLPTLEEVELRYLKRIYELMGRNKVRAAEVLGVTRQTLARRLGEDDA